MHTSVGPDDAPDAFDHGSTEGLGDGPTFT